MNKQKSIDGVLSFERDVSVAQRDTFTLYHLDPGIPDVVSIAASFYTFPDFATGEDLIQELTVGLIDKGSLRHDRFQIAEALEGLGASVDVQSSGLRVRVSCRCLAEHASRVLEIVREMLNEPAFDNDEFDKAKALLRADITRSMESTSVRAGTALTQQIYAAGHPNLSRDPEDELKTLASIELDDVRNYFETRFGAGSTMMCVVGDIGSDTAEDLAAGLLSDWDRKVIISDYSTASPGPESKDIRLEMPDRPNVDVRIGHGLSIRRDSEQFVPLYVGNYALGGNFSARLMRVIRDELGLTYGISSSLVGIEPEHGGHWRVAVTLSTERLDEGITRTLQEVRSFLATGAEEEEIESVRQTVAGSFKVSLNSTGGMASALLTNAERGFDVGYLDRFPREVLALKPDDVNRVLRSMLEPDRLTTVAVGTLP